MLRGRKDPLSGQPVRSIDHHQADKPTFKTYRPSGAAHSKSILVNPDTKSTLAIPHLNNRKFRKDHPLANDQAALDRLLAPQFQSGAVAEERKSFDHAFTTGDSGAGAGGAGPSRMDRLGGRSGSVRTGTSDGTGTGDGHGVAVGGRKRLLSGRGRRDHNKEESYGDGEEQLTSKALGVYIDKQGRLHDKEYDPFETVRSVSKKKFEGRSAFGAAREDDSEAGSDVSGSIGGGGGGGGGGRNDGRFGLAARNAGILEAYGRAASDWQLAAGGGNPAFEARDRSRVHDLQSRIRIEDTPRDVGDGYTARASKSWKQGDDEEDYQHHHAHEGDSTEDAMNRTVYSEYDSGVSATSPKVDDGRHQAFGYGGSNAHLPPAFRVARLQSDSRQPASSSAASSSGSRSSPNPSNKKSNPSSSAKTHASRLAQLEERPRSLLYPATPAQIAAQQEKEKARGKRGVHGDLGSDPDVFIPPIAPFNPAYHPARRGGAGGSSVHSLSSVERAISGRRGSYKGDGKPASTVFASHEMSYLPTRWARGDHEIRTNEEAIEKYRPLEWQGSQKAGGVSGNGEPDWTPSCMDAIKRNWHEFSLSLRFGAHRTKKKLQRKVQNAM